MTMTSDKVLLNGIIQAANGLMPVIRTGLLPIGVTFLFSFIFSQFFLQMMQLPDPEIQQSLIPRMGLFSVSATKSLILTLLIPLRLMDFRQNRAPTSLWKFTQIHAIPLTLESLRVLGQVILWLCVFIIPGIIKIVQLFFVPFVVMFDTRYHKGEIDALEESKSQAKGIGIMLFLLLLVTMLVEMAIDTLVHSYSIMTQPIITIAASLSAMLFSIFSYCVIFEVWRQRDTSQ